MKNSKKKIKTKDPLNKDLSSLFKEKGWKKIQFEMRPKDKTITLRMSEDLLTAIKLEAKKAGLDYQKWIRASLEEALKAS
ncbi:MAG: CopG family antitoxin [Bacteriovoracaceae bacterium]